jgi:hypothetical protein
MIIFILSIVFAASTGSFQFQLEENKPFYQNEDLEFVPVKKENSAFSLMIRSISSPKFNTTENYFYLKKLASVSGNRIWYKNEINDGANSIEATTLRVDTNKEALVIELAYADGEGGSIYVFVYDVNAKGEVTSTPERVMEESYAWNEHLAADFKPMKAKDPRLEYIALEKTKSKEKETITETYKLEYEAKSKKFVQKLIERKVSKH